MVVGSENLKGGTSELNEDGKNDKQRKGKAE